MMNLAGRDRAVAGIAMEILGLETLETQSSDALDFSDQAVWALRAALEAAYEAGLAAGKSGVRAKVKSAPHKRGPVRKSCRVI